MLLKIMSYPACFMSYPACFTERAAFHIKDSTDYSTNQRNDGVEGEE